MDVRLDRLVERAVVEPREAIAGEAGRERARSSARPSVVPRVRDLLEQPGEHRLERVDHADVVGVRRAVAHRERRAVEHLGAEAQVARAEPRARAVRVAEHVERAVLRTLGARDVPALVLAAEQALLPAVALAAGNRGEPAVRDPGLELAAVDALVVQRRGDRSVDRRARRSRMKVDREARVAPDAREQAYRLSLVTPARASTAAIRAAWRSRSRTALVANVIERAALGGGERSEPGR